MASVDESAVLVHIQCYTMLHVMVNPYCHRHKGPRLNPHAGQSADDGLFSFECMKIDAEELCRGVSVSGSQLASPRNGASFLSHCPACYVHPTTPTLCRPRLDDGWHDGCGPAGAAFSSYITGVNPIRVPRVPRDDPIFHELLCQTSFGS